MTCVAVALVAEMYTTSSEVSSDQNGKQTRGRRMRLQYGSSPIADFGIVAGKADVKRQDRLAYYNVVDHVFEMGQDPDDHY